MAEAGSMEVVAQAIISIPGLARDVLSTSYMPMLEVPYSEQSALAVTFAGRLLSLVWSIASVQLQLMNELLGR